MKELIIGLLVLLVGLFIAHRTGVSKGKREATIENLEEREELQNEIADAKLEAKRNNPISERLRNLRDRISKRRSS